MRKSLSFFLILAAIAAPVAANDLPLDRVFSSPNLSGPTPREPKLSPDGKFVTLLKNRPEDKDRYDLWIIDTATGAQRMLVDSQKIGSGGPISEEEKMRRFRLLEELQEEIVGAINKNYLGQTVEVLFEDKVKNRWKGRTPTNKLVFVESEEDLKGQILPVTVTWTGPWSMQANPAWVHSQKQPELITV